MLKRFYKSLFFSRRFYWAFVAVVFLFVFSYGLPFLFTISQILLLFLVVVSILDYIILFSRRQPVSVSREISDRLSNGDSNPVRLTVSNLYPFPVGLRIIDELPDQFQERNFSLFVNLKGGESQQLDYSLRPTERGEYIFHAINVFIKSPFRLLIRRKILDAETKVRVLPSYQALRQFELIAGASNLAEAGNKRIRKLGPRRDSEKIKENLAEVKTR